MTTEERAVWLEARRKGLGGSDASAALGFSPYTTPFELWQEKRGEVPDKDLSDNPFVEWGSRLEDVVADAYAEKTGNKVHRVNSIIHHPNHPIMLANLDRRVVGKPHGLEVKTANAWAARDKDEWGETGTDQIPAHYVFQVQHYMAVMNYVRFDVAALIGGNDFRIYTIHRNDAFIESLIAGELAFWSLVQTDVPPAAKTISDTRRKFASHVAKTYVEATDDVKPLVEEYLSLTEQLKAFKALDERKEELQAQIGDFMATNEILTVGGVDRLSFKGQSTGKRLPSSFKNAEPDIFAKYAVEGQTRIMRILKEKKS
jgi:putative phage-type endonuclease